MSTAQAIPANWSGPEGSQPQPAECADWSLTHRITFRFAFVYLTLYASYVLGNSAFTLIPWLSKPLDWSDWIWHRVVPWVGKHVLHLSGNVAYVRTGSGDTAFEYLKVFCFVCVAVVAAIAWSVADRKRAHYQWLDQWLRVLLRYAVAFCMLSYGFSKVFKLQFPDLSLARLIHTYGDSSPMGLLWTFMGASRAYTFFAGASELAGGMLLFFRRTATLGAMVTAGVMFNVTMMNFSYDVPVKLFSSHLVLICIFLMLPDMRRLANVLVLNRTAPPAEITPHFQRRWLRITAWLVKTSLIGSALGWTISADIKRQYGGSGTKAPKPALYGIWEAEEFTRNGQVVPPLVTDNSRWRKVVLQSPRAMMVRLMDDSVKRYSAQYDTDKKTVTIAPVEDAKQTAILAYVRPDTDHLLLEGRIGNDALMVKLRRIDETKFPLVNRGFHWINEFPFSR